MALLLPTVDPVHRVTITPRVRSLGVTQFRPIDDRRNYHRDYLLDRMAVRLGGRAAEEVACGEITSGAQPDLQDVTGLAWAMMHLDMTDEFGPRSFEGTTDDALAGRVPPHGRRKSTATRRRSASMRSLTASSPRGTCACTVLTENRAALDAIGSLMDGLIRLYDHGHVPQPRGHRSARDRRRRSAGDAQSILSY